MRKVKKAQCENQGCTNTVKRSGNRTCSRKCYEQARMKRESAGAPPQIVEESEHKDDGSWSIVKRADKPIKSEKDLWELIGADPQEWVLRVWKPRTYEGFAKIRTPQGKDESGKAVYTEHIEVVRQYGAHATLVPRVEVIQTRDFLQRLYADYSKSGPKVSKFKARRVPRTGNLGIFSAFDAHFGLLAWGKETGWQNYDIDIATRLWWEMVEKFVARAEMFGLEEIILLMGGDNLHVDSRWNVTTNGTPQDAQTRYIKTYKHHRLTVCDTATRLAANVAPVRIHAVDGNHDGDSTLTMMDAIGCFFKDHKGVTVVETPEDKFALEWGINGIMATHGTAVSGISKLKELTNVFAHRFPEIWGRTRVREVLTGHMHHEQVHDFHGCVLRRLPALCPPSAWTSRSNFVGSMRGCMGLIYNKEEGLIDVMRHTPGEDLRIR